MQLITIEHIRAAARRIETAAIRTPLLEQQWAPYSPFWLKAENLQGIGAFKIRGAYNMIATLSEPDRRRGVVAFSSGNHAQAVAAAAKAFGVPAVMVVPDTTPRVKVAATRAHGAEVIEVPIGRQEDAARQLGQERGLSLIPPYDHPAIIAGQGTIGLEVLEDLPGVQTVLVPVSGGGLAAGVGVAIKSLRPDVRVFGVEPELAADTAESLNTGVLANWPVEQRARTIADGLRAQPSALTFAHLRAVLDGVLTVAENEIRQAVRVLAGRSRLVAEPSGAVSTAAYLFHQDELPAGRTVAVVSGGNIDPGAFAEILSGSPMADGRG